MATVLRVPVEATDGVCRPKAKQEASKTVYYYEVLLIMDTCWVGQPALSHVHDTAVGLGDEA